MNFEELVYPHRYGPMGHLKELIDAGLTLNENLLYLNGDFYIIGKIDVYRAVREEYVWIIDGAFEKDVVLDEFMVIQSGKRDGKDGYLQLRIRNEEALKSLIPQIINPIDTILPASLSKIVIFENKK